jgi:diacylglycerol kinase (ATP)
MQRLIFALRNSLRALSRLARGERAVQQELALLVLAVPVGWFVAGSWAGYLTLIASLLFLLLVEVLNTAIEATCNAVSRDYRREIELAKDCGSLAVLIAILLTGAVWAFALWRLAAGDPI